MKKVHVLHYVSPQRNKIINFKIFHNSYIYFLYNPCWRDTRIYSRFLYLGTFYLLGTQHLVKKKYEKKDRSSQGTS